MFCFTQNSVTYTNVYTVSLSVLYLIYRGNRIWHDILYKLLPFFDISLAWNDFLLSKKLIIHVLLVTYLPDTILKSKCFALEAGRRTQSFLALENN